MMPELAGILRAAQQGAAAVKDMTDERPFRRRVFYIPGFDPFPPRRYREMYRKEGADQARLSGYDLSLRPAGKTGWKVSAFIDGRRTEAQVDVLVWSDIVQQSMAGGILATYAQLARTARAYVGSGALWRLMRLRKGPVIAALYPVVALVLQGIVALALGALAAWLVALVLPWVVGLAVGAGVVWAVLHGFRRIDRRLKAWYLMHDYAFVAQHGGADPPALTERLDQFAGRLRAALAEDWDEVLLVGHSSGAHMGVQVVARLIREGLPAGGPALGLLTLGQVVPMVSFLPRADALRADLALVSRSDALTWIDVTAPGDGCAFALCDPVAVTGVAPAGKRWPLVISAAFSRTLRPETWGRLRRQYFRLHFQYMHAFDNLPGQAWDYDYFRLTAGPRLLGVHFAGRPPSSSRIETAVNRHTGVAGEPAQA